MTEHETYVTIDWKQYERAYWRHDLPAEVVARDGVRLNFRRRTDQAIPWLLFGGLAWQRL